jgi:hypothetical protein
MKEKNLLTYMLLGRQVLECAKNSVSCLCSDPIHHLKGFKKDVNPEAVHVWGRREGL